MPVDEFRARLKDEQAKLEALTARQKVDEAEWDKMIGDEKKQDEEEEQQDEEDLIGEEEGRRRKGA